MQLPDHKFRQEQVHRALTPLSACTPLPICRTTVDLYAIGEGIDTTTWGGGYQSRHLIQILVESYHLQPSLTTCSLVLPLAATGQGAWLARAWRIHARSALCHPAPAHASPSLRPLSPCPSATVFGGTSLSVPLVGGAAVLMASVNNTLTGPQLKALLKQSVDPVPALAGLCSSGVSCGARHGTLCTSCMWAREWRAWCGGPAAPWPCAVRAKRSLLAPQIHGLLARHILRAREAGHMPVSLPGLHTRAPRCACCVCAGAAEHWTRGAGGESERRSDPPGAVAFTQGEEISS